MHPIIEQWFEELDEGEDELKEFIRQTSDVVLSEMGIPPQLIEYLEQRNLALVPLSRLWWDNPPTKLFGAVRTKRLTPPGHVEEPVTEIGVVDDDEAPETEFVDPPGRLPNRESFIEGTLEAIVVGQPVYYMTEPCGPMRQQDTGVGVVLSIHGDRILVKTQEGKEVPVDLGAGGRVTLRR